MRAWCDQFPNQKKPNQQRQRCGMCVSCECAHTPIAVLNGKLVMPSAHRSLHIIDNKMYIESCFTTFGTFVSVHRDFIMCAVCAPSTERRKYYTRHSHVPTECPCVCVCTSRSSEYISRRIEHMREGAHGTSHGEIVSDVNPSCVPFSPAPFARNKRFIQKVCVGGRRKCGTGERVRTQTTRIRVCMLPLSFEAALLGCTIGHTHTRACDEFVKVSALGDAMAQL